MAGNAFHSYVHCNVIYLACAMYLICWVLVWDLESLHSFDEYLDISEHSAVDEHLKLSSFPLRVPLCTIDGYHLFDEGALPSLLSTWHGQPRTNTPRKHGLQSVVHNPPPPPRTVSITQGVDH